jgi:hypothetical protein
MVHPIRTSNKPHLNKKNTPKKHPSALQGRHKTAMSSRAWYIPHIHPHTPHIHPTYKTAMSAREEYISTVHINGTYQRYIPEIKQPKSTAIK